MFLTFLYLLTEWVSSFMVSFNKGPINVVMVDDHKSRKNPKKNYNSFLTSVLRSIRKGNSEYVFSMDQVEELKKMLKSDEKLGYKELEGYILVCLL